MTAMTVRDTVNDPAPSPAAGLGHIGRDDFDRDIWCLLGLPIDIADIAKAAIAVEAAVRDGRRLSFVTPNVNWLVRAAADAEARRQILDADLSLADGAPLVLFSRLLGVPQKSRAAGADLFEALRRRPGFKGRRIRVFFFGGRDGSARAAFERLETERGGLEAAGWLNPGHGDLESMSNAETIDAINAAKADFVVVALGASKGQAWIDRNKARLDAPVIAHLGAVVDFTGGAVTRAPKLMAAAGLEWAWRIAADPALAKRYLKDGIALARLAAQRLLPQLLASRKMSGRPLAVSLEQDSGGTIIRITGDAAAGDLAAVRDAFRTAAAAPRATTLDLSGAGAIDLAFLGLVLMLEKHLARAGSTLHASGLTKQAARLFRANAMPYLTPEEERTAKASARSAAV